MFVERMEEAGIFQDAIFMFDNWWLKKNVKMITYFCNCWYYDVYISGGAMGIFTKSYITIFVILSSNATFSHLENFKWILFQTGS